MNAISTLLQQALALHQRGKFVDAIDLYALVLAREPENFDALHLMGVAERQRGHPQAAVNWIDAALDVREEAIAHCNRGVALQDLGRTEEALAAFSRALELKRDYAMAWSNHGNALHKLGREREALDSYARAVALQPDYAEAWANQGIVLHQLGAFEEALACFGRSLALKPQQDGIWTRQGMSLLRLQDPAAALASLDRALDLRPDAADALRARGNALRALGRREEAVASYRAARAAGAVADDIDFLLASLGEMAAPAAAPASYVSQLFDQYAGHFDQHLQGQLAYATPQQLEAMLQAAGQGRVARAADLGCGTGLCGPWLRPLADELIGVDLSARMLAQADARGCYDRLDCAELVDWLGDQSELGLLVAADVFVYLGALDGLFAACRWACLPSARFAFSVESGPAQGYRLGENGRYAHSEAYVAATAAQHGWRVLTQQEAVLREEQGVPVIGHLWLLEKVLL
ncbi:tetratricopeptide repeat protein [Massilia sp. TS11]|uniref:tetratricopeptide repeat protein n=1 Tax=Massilia sp. TS11 TaxID=2908003 RepID=UPI001EDC7BF8|nr:tetratricopeptide repeat protein [Massilia sp. TS11]MCG2583999.1 tetratricopeptide repeat protein [Massilia sp. TS11]